MGPKIVFCMDSPKSEAQWLEHWCARLEDQVCTCWSCLRQLITINQICRQPSTFKLDIHANVSNLLLWGSMVRNSYWEIRFCDLWVSVMISLKCRKTIMELDGKVLGPYEIGYEHEKNSSSNLYVIYNNEQLDNAPASGLKPTIIIESWFTCLCINLL